MAVVKDQITTHQDTAAPKFKGLCEDLEACLHDVLSAVKILQVEPRGLHGRFREVVKLASTADRIARYQNRIRNLRSNVVLAATMDTNFQMHKLTSEIQATIQTPPRINTCPPPSRIFQGRQAILDKMYDFFSEKATKQHVVLLHGLGGSGKTQIALTFIEEECSLFTDIFFIDASTQNTIEAGLSEIAVAKTSGRTPREALQWLRTTQEKWLLFFDNADDPKLNLNAFLPRGRHGNVLITSRNPGLSVYAGANHRVSDMEEEDAVPLLLTSAAQDDTPENQKIAGEIVKELSYLPLAIVQAGAFISRSGALESYLSLYHSNKARLLSEVPTQSHDDYAWTVYTTWHISFDRLSLTAATLLQLCSFLHHKGISEKLFSAAAAYQVKTYGPTKEEVEKTVEFLGRFKGSTGAWDSLQFMDVTNELRAYSLINYDAQTKTFSIHPLVHAWSQSILSQPATDKSCMTSIIGMQITALVPEEQDLAVILLPHIDALLPSHDVANLVVVPAFDLEYGVLYYYTGRFAQAEKLLLSALATRRTALGEDHFDTLVTMNHLATTYLHLGRWREAEGMQCIVVRKGTLMLGPDHPYVLVAAGSLAAIYTSLGRDSEALDLQVEITEKSKRILSEDDVNNVTAMGNLGVMLMNVGRLEEAEEMQLVVVEKRLKNRGGVHPDTLAAMSNLGMVYAKLGKLAKAEETQVVVLQRTRETEGEDSAGTLLAMNNLAVTYREMGRLDEAERELATVLRKRREFLGEEHPDTLSAMASLAWTYHMLGRFEEAKELGVVTVQKRRALLGDAHRDTIESMERLIKTLEKTGKLEARAELEAALDKVKPKS